MNLNRLPRAQDMIRGSAPLDVIRVVFPVGFDPSVSGYPGPEGAVGMSVDGTKAWTKGSSASNFAWVREFNASAVAGYFYGLRTQLGRTAALEFPVANAFDPSVTGLAAPVGSRATTISGTKAWTKYGTANTEWRRVHVSGGSVVVVGAPVAAVDVDVVAGVDDGCRFTFMGNAASAPSDLYLRLNGSAAVGWGQVTNVVLYTNAPVFLGNLQLGGSQFHVVLGRSHNHRRRLRLGIGAEVANGWAGAWGAGLVVSDDITSIGVLVGAGTSQLGVGSVVNAVCESDLGVSP